MRLRPKNISVLLLPLYIFASVMSRGAVEKCSSCVSNPITTTSNVSSHIPHDCSTDSKILNHSSLYADSSLCSCGKSSGPSLTFRPFRSNAIKILLSSATAFTTVRWSDFLQSDRQFHANDHCVNMVLDNRFQVLRL